MATTRVFDLREMKDWSRILLADFNAKISAWFMNLSNISIDVKMCVCLPLMKNHFLRCWDFSFSSKSDGGSDICFIAKTASKKIGAWTISMKFLSSGSLLSQ